MRRILIRGVGLWISPVGFKSVMKVALAMMLISASSAANAATMILLSHQQTSGTGTISTLINDGNQINGPGIPSTAVWDWDGTTLTATGLYTATGSIGSSPVTQSVLTDHVIDLSIDTGAGSATATSYNCIEGTFLQGVGTNGCGGYDFGANYLDDSATVWTGITASQTIGGDDVLMAGPRLVGAYGFDTVSFTGTGMDVGDQVLIGNGIAVGTNFMGVGGELMTFQITSAGPPPVVAVDDTAGGRANEAINIDVLGNDQNIVDNVQALTTTAPTNGAAILNGLPPDAQSNLSIDYTSAIGFTGAATFDYTVTDANGSSATATVTVTVTNQVPVALDDTSATGLVTPVIVDVLANDTLGDGPSAAIAITVQPPNGTVIVANSPNPVPANIVVTYTPDIAHTGPDTFTYELTDDNGDTDTALVTVTTSAVLAAVDDSATTDAATPVSIDVLANDANVVNPDFSVDVTTQPAKGVVTTGPLPVICTLPANCSLSYAPNAGQVGNDTFVYQVTDNLGTMSSATVTVFVNDVPVAVDDPMMTALPATATSLDVQANDTGLNDTPITIAVTGNPANGTAAPDVGTPQQITYTSAVGFNGQDVFTYELQDGNGDTSNPATVTVTVNDQPVANDNGTVGAPAFFLSPGQTLSLDVLANDMGLTDTPLTVSLVNPVATLGAPTIAGSPGDASAIAVDYVAGSTLGTDAFGYQITDNSGDTASATVYVAVTDQGIPVAIDDLGTWPDSTNLNDPDAIFVNVLANDQRLDDEPLLLTITTDPTNGYINLPQGCTTAAGLCKVWYTANPGFVGTDMFQYMVTDNTPDSSNIATVTITVSAVPTAVDDPVSVQENGPASFNIDVLGNDTGLSALPVTVELSSPAVNGFAVVEADNTITYTQPAGGGVKTDTFVYTVTDASTRSSSATVIVTIVPEQSTLPGRNSSAIGPAGLGLLLLVPWLRRRRRRA